MSVKGSFMLGSKIYDKRNAEYDGTMNMATILPVRTNERIGLDLGGSLPSKYSEIF